MQVIIYNFENEIEENTMAKKPIQNGQGVPTEMNEAKRAVLDKALGDIVKRYGEGSIMRLGETHSLEVEAIPTGSPRSTVPNPPARQPFVFISSLKPNIWVEQLPSSTWNTPWTHHMLSVWA